MSDLVESMEDFDNRMLARLASAGVLVERTSTGFKWTCERLGKSGQSENNFGSLLRDLFTMTGVFEEN